MENDVNTVLGIAPKNESSTSSNTYSRFTRLYTINDSAESTLNAISWIVLVLGILGGLIILFTMSSTEVPSEYYSSKTIINPTGIVTGIASIFASVMWWAMMQVFINISNNLKNLNAAQSSSVVNDNSKTTNEVHSESDSNKVEKVQSDDLFNNLKGDFMNKPLAREFAKEIFDYHLKAKEQHYDKETETKGIEYIVKNHGTKASSDGIPPQEIIDSVIMQMNNI